MFARNSHRLASMLYLVQWPGVPWPPQLTGSPPIMAITFLLLSKSSKVLLMQLGKEAFRGMSQVSYNRRYPPVVRVVWYPTKLEEEEKSVNPLESLVLLLPITLGISDKYKQHSRAYNPKSTVHGKLCHSAPYWLSFQIQYSTSYFLLYFLLFFLSYSHLKMTSIFMKDPIGTFAVYRFCPQFGDPTSGRGAGLVSAILSGGTILETGLVPKGQSGWPTVDGATSQIICPLRPTGPDSIDIYDFWTFSRSVSSRENHIYLTTYQLKEL